MPRTVRSLGRDLPDDAVTLDEAGLLASLAAQNQFRFISGDRGWVCQATRERVPSDVMAIAIAKHLVKNGMAWSWEQEKAFQEGRIARLRANKRRRLQYWAVRLELAAETSRETVEAVVAECLERGMTLGSLDEDLSAREAGED